MLGVLIMVWPSETVAIVGVIMGLVALVWGVVTALGAFDLRRAGLRFEEARSLERQRAELAWLDVERSDAAGTAEGPQEEIQPPDVKAA